MRSASRARGRRAGFPLVAAVLLVPGVTGCSGRPPETSAITPSETDYAFLANAGTGFNFRSASSFTVVTDTVPVAPDRAWLRLAEVYRDLAVPVGTYNPEARILGNVRHVVRRRLGDLSLSRLLDCGSGITGPNAGRYEVRLTVLSQVVEPAGTSGRSVVHTHVRGVGRPVGHQGSPVTCRSTGRLEEEIARRVLGWSDEASSDGGAGGVPR